MFQDFYKCVQTWSDQTFYTITDKTYTEKFVKKQDELSTFYCDIITLFSQENYRIKQGELLCYYVFFNLHAVLCNFVTVHPFIASQEQLQAETQLFRPRITFMPSLREEKIARSQFRDYLHNKHAKLLAIMPER